MTIETMTPIEAGELCAYCFDRIPAHHGRFRHRDVPGDVMHAACRTRRRRYLWDITGSGTTWSVGKGGRLVSSRYVAPEIDAFDKLWIHEEGTSRMTEIPTELAEGEYWSGRMNPNVGPVPVPEWEFIEPDGGTRCARGHLCKSYHRPTGLAAMLGPYVDDSDDMRPRHAWATPWYFESAPRLLMCEDCADAIETEGDDTVFTGDIADVAWFIDIAPADDAGFYAWVGAFSPDHALTWEHELGRHDTVGEALAAIEAWGAERNEELAKAEAEIDAAMAHADD